MLAYVLEVCLDDAMSETHTLILAKPSRRQLRDKVIASNVEALMASVNSRALVTRGWTIQPIHSNGSLFEQVSAAGTAFSGGSEYVYRIPLTVKFERPDDKRPESSEFPAIARTIATRAGQPNFGRWALIESDGAPYVPVEERLEQESADSVTYAYVDMPEDWDSNFSHLYGLDAQITRIRRALEAGIMSDWNNRYHCALVGPPGCGKSDICQTIKSALGEDAVLEFDATATTAAGAIKELTEREVLPRILLVEEIEKADEKAMSFLLSVLDLRSSIRKTTARTTIQRDTKLFAIATVNDIPLFERLQAGALASRFANRISFKRPSRAQLEMILKREVKRVKGDTAWIKPTLDYCHSVGIDDPRRVTAVCLCGREMLLTGEYQKLLTATSTDMEV